ncbi:hypothetical protein J4E81_008168 [Alternaria sp. BMP 2799]|nr:hypothetical protein J4E81_008168 [Alternaria sp. BMP 2799]
MSEDYYVNAVAPPGQYMRHLSESTTCLDVQGLFTGLGEYDTCFDDTRSLGVGEENFDLESWNTASSKPAIVKRSQIDEFANATPPFTYPQSLTGNITDAGFDGINQQIRRRPQLGFDERSYGQFASRSSSRLQKPRNNIAPTGFTVPHNSAELFLSLDPLYSAQSRLLPGLKGAPVPGTNLLRLSHACFLGTIPLPDMAFHAPGMAISAKTEEVLRRAVPEYKAGAPSLADKSMLSGDNSRSGDDLFDELSSPT